MMDENKFLGFCNFLILDRRVLVIVGSCIVRFKILGDRKSVV